MASVQKHKFVLFLKTNSGSLEHKAIWQYINFGEKKKIPFVLTDLILSPPAVQGLYASVKPPSGKENVKVFQLSGSWY